MKNIAATAPQAKVGFLKDVCAYFRDFLDTDFKRQAAPKRSISLRDSAGNLSGIDVGKYPELGNDIWQLLRKPLSEGEVFSLAVSRGRYRGRIKAGLLEVISKQVGLLQENQLRAIADRAAVAARSNKERFENDPDQYRETVVNGLRSDLVRTVVVPLLKRLETALEAARGDAYEAIFNIEDELGDRLIDDAREAIGAGLATALAENSFEELDGVLREIVDSEPVKLKLTSYFQSFVTTDFFQELHELSSTLKIRDNFETYLYICELSFGRASYPVFYLPVSVELEDRVFRVTADPHLYINKKAVDFAAQEVSRETGGPNLVKIDERILYLDAGESFADRMQRLLDRWTADLAMVPLDLSREQNQKSSRSQITIANALHFVAFDKADEAMLNDYEELMGLLRTGEPVALDFTDIVLSFLSKDPIALDRIVAKEWEDAPVDAHLVFASPVPLNEEQRKVLGALRRPECRFLAIEGPPGCGKSHTIVAIVFEAILTGKNVLVLSDKKEALDVVEEKLTTVLNGVRTGADFQNPLLRLGKAGNTYGKILSAQSLDRIKTHHKVGEATSRELKRKIDGEEAKLKGAINQTVAKGQAIDLGALAELARDEAQLSNVKQFDEILVDDTLLTAVVDAQAIAAWCTGAGAPVIRLLQACAPQPRLGDLAIFLGLQKALSVVPALTPGDVTVLQFFTAFAPQHHAVLESLIRQYQALRLPLIGFAFRRARARAIDQELGQHLPCRSSLDAHRKIDRLLRAASILSDLRVHITKASIATQHQHLVYQQMIDGLYPLSGDLTLILSSVTRLGEALKRYPQLTALGISANDLGWTEAVSVDGSLLSRAAHFVSEFQGIKRRFGELPEFDYLGQKSRLESLHTQRLAHTIDERVIEFVTEHRHLARALRDVIRKRQRFPRDAFDELKKAFPCMIAGIRDYAEYVPLERGLFDLVIIDEASQVSIAQAFPAFIRAKQLVVLGDRRQFSNVKTTNASGAINAKYAHEVVDNFRRGMAPDAVTLNRVKMFNIKVSVLDFVERIANYEALLKKHFRGYPELISFSSKTFYDGQLQVMKIRGKPIGDVLRLTDVGHDGRTEAVRNTNSVEAEAILHELRELAQKDDPPSVGIITPHTEQQAYLVQLINRQQDAEQLNDALDLKVMTFDTCQGEERDVILYSMVATRASDRLNYVFPRSLDEADEVDHVLRQQRLNVGFSRAKECIHFFVSKPLEEFSGAIGQALQHFRSTLERGKTAPGIADTDPRSPMEKKVLAWIYATSFVQKFGQYVTVDPQFRLGDYLRQLDPTYHHPSYKVDFLVKVVRDKSVSIIIEYDGFKEHFTNLDEVDASNYGVYMKPEDVERQKVLESYGYRFLRLNRFNLGKDPVRTLDERLVQIAQDAVLSTKPHAFVEEVKHQATSLANGDMQQCSVCGEVKVIAEFRDMKLASGYGRKCKTCKRQGRRRRRQ
jgi:hypothetical protein